MSAPFSALAEVYAIYVFVAIGWRPLNSKGSSRKCRKSWGFGGNNVLYFPLLVLKGIDHYWKYVFFFSSSLSKWTWVLGHCNKENPCSNGGRNTERYGGWFFHITSKGATKPLMFQYQVSFFFFFRVVECGWFTRKTWMGILRAHKTAEMRRSTGVSLRFGWPHVPTPVSKALCYLEQAVSGCLFFSQQHLRGFRKVHPFTDFGMCVYSCVSFVVFVFRAAAANNRVVMLWFSARVSEAFASCSTNLLLFVIAESFPPERILVQGQLSVKCATSINVRNASVAGFILKWGLLMMCIFFGASAHPVPAWMTCTSPLERDLPLADVQRRYRRNPAKQQGGGLLSTSFQPQPVHKLAHVGDGGGDWFVFPAPHT